MSETMSLNDMKLKLDKNKKYAIALDGGGAKGGYEIGAWKALDEAGIEYTAVSGTSVGALNGSYFALRRLEGAIEIWSGMELKSVIAVEEEYEEVLGNILSGDFDFEDVIDFLPKAQGILQNRGLDISPLRAWIKKAIDPEEIKSSDVALYITTFCISDREEMVIKVNDLPADEIHDMLLASAYHPSFRLEPLGGKYYTDGALVDKLPVWPLVRDGYKDIIAVHIPGSGRYRRFEMPEDIRQYDIRPVRDLGRVLNFDKEQSIYDMNVGYYDAMKLLYGLSGNLYYLERTFSEEEALAMLASLNPAPSLRTLCERELPALARRLGCRGDYYDILVALAEEAADAVEAEPFRIVKDTDFFEEFLSVQVPGF